MNFKRALLSIATILVAAPAVIASPASDTTSAMNMKPSVERFYVGSGLDGAIFSSATIKHGTTSSAGVLRFSYFINLGLTFNFNFGRYFGVYTGLDIKNIGYIEHDDVTHVKAKKRTYNLGAPIGIRIGDVARRRNYMFFGAGADLPFNYKEKYFVKRSAKTKMNEWFSDRTPAVMPYVFVGAAIGKRLTVKAQYYTNNFMNPDFAVNTVKPYAGTEVHPILLSIGINGRVSKKHGLVKPRTTSMNTM